MMAKDVIEKLAETLADVADVIPTQIGKAFYFSRSAFHELI